jgi:hypothetical protein
VQQKIAMLLILCTCSSHGHPKITHESKAQELYFPQAFAKTVPNSYRHQPTLPNVYFSRSRHTPIFGAFSNTNALSIEGRSKS